ncbi:MAG: transcription antitermination factor NusB [Bacteriovoracaceae bacterium]|nr:transcription antitermination factor NusB [Bacteriovoracaceae bacterium]
MKTIKKTQARNYAFKFLFQLQMKELSSTKEDILSDLESHLEDFDTTYVEPDSEHLNNQFDNEIKSFATGLIRGVLTQESELAKNIEPLLNKGTLSKMTPVNRLSLLIGSYEVLFCSDVPTKVAINEAINLAKEYGTKDSHSLINGVLDKLS